MLFHHLKKNLQARLYRGKNMESASEIKYKDAICQGEQEAIIERSVWERGKEIQRSIDPQADHSRRQETIAPLKSVLKCGHCGGAMMPTYSNKGGRRYYCNFIQNTLLFREFAVLYLFSVWESLHYKYLSFIG